jgi:hypothetical protein
MRCQICNTEANKNSVSIQGKLFTLCTWCCSRVDDYIKSNISHDVINIFWGSGRIASQDWIGEHSIRDFLRENNITEVFEIGTGLSTEIFVNEGLKVVSLDSCAPHMELYKNLAPLKGKVDFIYYKDSDSLPDIAKLYPNKKWDFVFVDSPHTRANEVKLALTIASKYLYLHDPNLGEQAFFPNDEWEPMWNKESKLYQRKTV